MRWPSSRWVIGGIVLLALAASWTGLRNGFTYDDLFIVQQNPRVLSLHSWWEIFGSSYWVKDDFPALYRPLTTLGFALQWAIGHGSPFVFHLTNVLLYVATAVAFYWVASMLVPPVAAAVAAALFAVHPVHVEAVGNVVGQAELSCAAVVFLALGVYIKYRQRGALTWRTMGLLAGLYAIACLFKEHGILLPALFVAAEVTVLRGVDRVGGTWRELRPLFLLLFAIALGFLYVRSLVLGAFTEVAAVHLAFIGEPWSTRFWTMMVAMLEWLRLLVWPAHLSADYSPSELRLYTGPDPLMMVTVVLMLGIVGIASVLPAPRRRIAYFALLWISITIALVSNLVFASGVIVAERTLFMPSAGAMLFFALIIYQVAEIRPLMTRVFAGAVGVVLLLGMVHSARRQLVWKDNTTLFTSILEDAPMSYRGHWAFAAALAKSGHMPESIRVLETAVRLFDRDPDLLDELGYGYRLTGRCPEAIPYYERAVDLGPYRTRTWGRFATCLVQMGMPDSARAVARRVMSVPPDDPPTAIRVLRITFQQTASHRPSL